MSLAVAPLTLSTAATSWTVDAASTALLVLAGSAYAWCCRRAHAAKAPLPAARRAGFWSGIAVWALATMSMVGVYAPVLFWVRALQVLLLLFVVPMLLALGTPLTALRAAGGAALVDRMLAGKVARVLTHPATTSVLMLATPWLLYLTPWYVAALTNQAIESLTRIVLVLIGFCYFYARIQADPVPRRYPQMISVVISIAETLGDGLLGLVLWLGPLVATDYYLALNRTWGPSMRVDQSIGAGVLWILGDVLGVPFLMVLMRALSSDEQAQAAVLDAELDAVDDTSGEQNSSALWWEADPQLRDRFQRRTTE
ncbi:cytochrome c oxidase assembly protein [Mycolicibacterium fluoranthenivorans]|uniref:Cytochrome c oxidase assembly factor CtaG n=1 Tax=Mycolicibacterium fluoranthenivorans TaxID=258505 RepID=A0A1G4VKP3_9MYCO|nr:cytochrome c oxidase assembly protein [Mycolicibacterium fluoranthenivorans]SCX08198.1 Cytochrome c oxidase assembly factor CtaG [Mycolicibacterium fluoranthenivorans]